jgi:hypothetical protein
MTDIPRDPAWQLVTPVPDGLLIALGLPQASTVYRKLVSDGVLWAALAHDAHGWILSVSHTVDGSVAVIVPGRFPTLVEIYAARKALLTDESMMTVLLEIPRPRVQARWPDPPVGALPTTIFSLEVHLEDVTDDLVTTVPAPAPPAPSVSPDPDSFGDDEEP